MANGSWRLLIRANEIHFEPIRWQYTKESAPKGEIDLGPVNPQILGYWVELQTHSGAVLYRAFVNRLPVGLITNWNAWGPRKQSQARYWLQIPALEQAERLLLFEQAIPTPKAPAPVLTQHFSVTLPAGFSGCESAFRGNPLISPLQAQCAL